MGGLGNQLFQIFATIAYALHNGHSFAFQRKENMGRQDRPSYWRNFFVKLQPYLVDHLPNITFWENGFDYKPLPIVDSNTTISIEGYFQSDLHFKSKFMEVCDIIGLNEFQTDLLASTNSLNGQIDYSRTISMHFRLGDYKHNEHYIILPYEYYSSSLHHILNKDTSCTNVLYFCEVEDNDTVLDTIIKLQVDFPGITFNKAPDSASDWQQVLMMSVCKHHIIANSSFSWWGAYLHRYLLIKKQLLDEHLVCCPNSWFGTLLSHLNTKDLRPSEWITI